MLKNLIYIPKIKINKEIRQIMASIFLAVLTAIIGYFVVDYFSREKLSIQNISVKQKYIEFDIDSRLYQEINSIYRMGSYYTFSNDDISKSGGTISSESIKKILEELSKISDNLNQTLNRVSNIYNIKPNDTIKTLKNLNLTNFRLRSFSYLDDYSKMSKIELQNARDTIASYYLKTNNVIKKFVGVVYRKILESQREFQIEVVLFNNGDKQAVSKYKGQLAIGNSIINLKKLEKTSEYRREDEDIIKAIKNTQSKEQFLSNLVIIEARSFNGLTLIMDPYNNKQRDMAVARTEYRAGQKTAKLTLFDIKDKEFETTTFDFKIDLDQDQGETMLKYLQTNYKSSLPEYVGDFDDNSIH